jgi:small subunit ribosomal protein S5
MVWNREGKAAQMRNAIDKAINSAYLNVIPIKLGCGSWECRCNQLHSIPFKVSGRGGSVTIEILPGPRGLGLVAGENIRSLLKLAGLKDAWTKSFGSTNTGCSGVMIKMVYLCKNTWFGKCANLG